MKNRLVELMKKTVVGMENGHEVLAETIWLPRVFEATADRLLANGVIVPPCKVGDKVFYLFEVCDEQGKEETLISEGKVVSFSLQEEGLWAYVRYKGGLTYWHVVEKDFGKTVFLTREEAEKALAEREGKG